MEIKHTMDPVGVMEGIFYRMFHDLFHNEGARRHLGFRQIHCFTDHQGMPGWYLWLDGQPGAYQIALVDNVLHHQPAASIPLPITGRFVVRYFPVDTEETFDSMSVFEQMVRVSALFDQTGTPTAQARQTMHPSHFTIGHINARTNVERDILEMECRAPNRWLTIRTDGLSLATENGESYEAVAPGGTDRNFPGWELCFFLFDRLVSAFCLVHKQKPILCATAKAEGYHFIIDADNNTITQRSEQIEELLLLTTIPIDQQKQVVKRATQDIVSYGQHIQVYLQLLNPSHWQIVQDPHNHCHEWVNHQWWHISNLECLDDTSLTHCCYCDH
jgi:hypothetical protein